MKTARWPLGLGLASALTLAAAANGLAQDSQSAQPAQTEQSAQPATAAQPVQPTPAATDDWPCEQPERPEISTGSVWTGPDPTAAAEAWHDVPAVVALIEQVAPRRVAQDEAIAAIHRFSAGYTTDRQTVLTEVFAGLFDTLDKERSEIIRGIRHFNRRQDNLSKRIEAGWKIVDGLDPNSTDPAVTDQRNTLQAAIDWDSRIFDDRQKLLPAICQQPIVIEQRLFALSRAVQQELGPGSTQ